MILPLSNLQQFLTRHLALRDALLWALPAIAFGAALRLLLLHYSPYAYWGSDSRSYYDFTHRLFADHGFTLNEKRRVLYPILLAVVSFLPGTPLKWIAWLQHRFGLLTLVPLAYLVRRIFTFMRWWVIPVTVLYAGLPVILWYEHELLGETLFFSLLLCSFAGWTAWIKGPSPESAARWWAFFVPFALFILTKPSGRFYWPGLLLGCVLVAAWRLMKRAHFAALAALMVATLMLGSKEQGAWLFYVAAFPLTQTETAPHAEYKAQIRHLVKPLHENLDTYYHELDEGPFEFLGKPHLFPERPLWAALAGREEFKTRLYLELAIEGVKAEPLNFLYLGLQRAVASANLSTFKAERFSPDYMRRRFRDDYETAFQRVEKNLRTPIPLALGYPLQGPLPPFEEIAKSFAPAANSSAPRAVMAWVKGYQEAAELVRMPEGGTVAQTRLTLLGWWFLAAVFLSFTNPYRSTFGVWTLAALGYTAGVFLVSQANPRYFGPAWPVFVPLLALPADVLCRWMADVIGRRKKQRSSARSVSPVV